MVQNGIIGIPGTMPSSIITNAVMPRAFALCAICEINSAPKLFFEAALVTIIPEDVEIISAGIWLTKPSPMVNMVYVLMASSKGLPSIATPKIKPPTIFRAVIIRPAMASPLTNFEAPSIEP